MTEYLGRLLSEPNFSKDLLQAMKERLGYVAPDYEAELDLAMSSTVIEKEFQLPGGGSITLGSERFRCGEVRIRPPPSP